jgi:HAD superfamily hydrolase (TIGR01509 family)
MPDAYLLDLYDTLVSADWQAWWTELQAITGATERQLTTAYDRTRIERNQGAYESPEEEMKAVLAAGEIADPHGSLAAKLITAEAELGGNIVLYDDVMPSLEAFHAAGARTAIVSNCNRGTRAIVERLALDRAVDEVVLSCEVGAAKPDEKIYRTALDALGVDPASAVFVDDQTAYCDGARAIGIDTRLIVRPDAAPGEGFAPSTNGHVVITSLRELS